MLSTETIREIWFEINEIRNSGVMSINKECYNIDILDIDALRQIVKEELSRLEDYVLSIKIDTYHQVCEAIHDKLECVASSPCNVDAWLEFIKMSLYSLQDMFESDDLNDLVYDVLTIIAIAQKYYLRIYLETAI